MAADHPIASDANNFLTLTKCDSPAPQGAALSRRALSGGLLAAAALSLPARSSAAAGLYAWQPAEVTSSGNATLMTRFGPPASFDRLPLAPQSFGAWLRGLPLKPDGALVHLYTGAEKPRQDVQAAVLAIDTGARDLQQCADAVMRLRAEWLFATGRAQDIAFDLMGGGRVPFARWAKGERPAPSGKSWTRKAPRDLSYANLRRYLDFIFAYAGTLSLEKELVEVSDAQAVMPGDVFIKGGAPGHAVLVADVAAHATTGARRFLLIQSYMPAQEMHVLRNPANPDGSPWYGVPYGPLVTPEWTFPPGALRRWP